MQGTCIYINLQCPAHVLYTEYPILRMQVFGCLRLPVMALQSSMSMMSIQTKPQGWLYSYAINSFLNRCHGMIKANIFHYIFLAILLILTF